VAPWRSVHKIHYLTSVDLRFVLTSGGHNAGIVSEPGRPRRSYQALDRPAGANYISPDDWLKLAPQHEGSWWEDWAAWLDAHSGQAVAPPAIGSADYPPLADAPGSYVLEK
jgi:polyhydroxyalkanoate synthase